MNASTTRKKRLFTFSLGCNRATVTCRHCGWSVWGKTLRHSAQVTFDLSNGHECPGVESYSFRFGGA